MGRATTRTRYAELGRVFKHGVSELLNGVARLAAIYEDLRIEIGELRRIQFQYEESGSILPEYRTIYFLRRGLASVFEFRRALTLVRKSEEFKNAEAGLTETDRQFIVNADIYLQEHWQQIKDLRNEFGAHMQAEGVQFATANVGTVVGGITWNHNSDGLPMGWSAILRHRSWSGLCRASFPATRILTRKPRRL